MDPQPTPLPIFKVLVASSIMFCNTFMATVLLPFLSFMVGDFKLSPNPDDIGRYAGYLVASFMLGQVCSSYIWGTLSDRFGRRPILLIGLFLTGFSFLSFGFSTTYPMAIALRTANGALNGMVGVCKTYMSEITDSTNQARGFSIFGVVRGAGLILGPIVGGYLSLPADKYPSLFKGGIFEQYPYALPCVIGWCIAMTSFTVGFFVLQETNVRVLRQSTSPATSSYLGRVWSWMKPKKVGEEQELLLDLDTNDASDLDSVTAVSPPLRSVFQILSIKRVILSLGLYGLVSFLYIQFDELFALWSRLPFSEGGLEFSSADQGSAYAIGGVLLFLYQLFLFAPLERALGCLRMFQTGVIISLPAFIILPFIGTVLKHDGETEWLMWVLVGLCQILRNVGGIQAFTSTFIMISNSITSESRGTVNGIGQSIGMLGPVFGGTLFSWSLENELSLPFDFHFMFILLFLLVLLTLCISFFMPADIDQRLPEPEDEELVDC